MRILFCIPVNRGQCSSMALFSYGETIWPCEHDTFKLPLGKTTTSAGNICGAMMIRDDKYSHLIVAHNDIGWAPDALEKLMAPNKDVIAAWGVGRTWPHPMHTAKEYSENRPLRFRTFAQPGKGVQQVQGIGGGLWCIKRHVFKTIPFPWFEWHEHWPEGHWPETETEDYDFSRKCKKHGLGLFVHWGVVLKHEVTGYYSEGQEIKVRKE